jgi:hypothetical protein
VEKSDGSLGSQLQRRDWKGKVIAAAQSIAHRQRFFDAEPCSGGKPIQERACFPLAGGSHECCEPFLQGTTALDLHATLAGRLRIERSATVRWQRARIDRIFDSGMQDFP